MISVIVKNVVIEAKAVVRLVLGRADNVNLPPFEAGAHIHIKLPNGLLRQYSLCRLQCDPRYYEIAVLKDPQSRGGSAEVHNLKIGDKVEVSEPKNHFSLLKPKKNTLLIAGGIGVTPLITMAQTLHSLGTPFAFHYCAKSSETAAFVEALKLGPFSDKIVFHFSQELQSGRMDVEQVLGEHIRGTDLYICGPAEFITYVLTQARLLGWSEERLHREYFAAPVVAENVLEDMSFTVKIASSAKQFTVGEGQSISQVLEVNGIFIPVACESGVCGTCQTGVVEGNPEHRDVFLTDKEKAQGKLIMPCCSRAKTGSITLDL